MANYQVGDNLYGNDAGQYWSNQKGNYFDANKKKQFGYHRVYQDSPFDSSKKYLNGLFNAQQKNQLDALKQQQTKATAGFNQQKKELAPVYQGQRNQADVANAQGVSRLRELMAANGINASGENVTASAGLASQRQSSLNDINMQQNQATQAINRQIADVNDPAQAQAIMNQIGVGRSSALTDAYNQYLQRLQQQQQDFQSQQQYKAAQEWQKHTFDNMSAEQKASQEWQKYLFSNMSAEQKAALGMNKYQIDSGNAANSAASAAELAYYKNAGFPTP